MKKIVMSFMMVLLMVSTGFCYSFLDTGGADELVLAGNLPNSGDAEELLFISMFFQHEAQRFAGISSAANSISYWVKDTEISDMNAYGFKTTRHCL